MRFHEEIKIKIVSKFQFHPFIVDVICMNYSFFQEVCYLGVFRHCSLFKIITISP